MCSDASGNPRYVLTGTWDDLMEGAKVVNSSETTKGKPVLETGPHKVLWKRKMPP